MQQETWNTEYDYNKESVSLKLPSREIRTQWFKGFGLSFYIDHYAPMWHTVVKKTYNLVLFCVRIQIIIR